MPVIDYNKLPHLKPMDNIHGAIAHSDQLTVGFKTLEKGAQIPEHAHPQEQWFHILEGELDFFMGGEQYVLTRGISVHIPQSIPHSARAISKGVVIDTFFPVREDFKFLEPWPVGGG